MAENESSRRAMDRELTLRSSEALQLAHPPDLVIPRDAGSQPARPPLRAGSRKVARD